MKQINTLIIDIQEQLMKKDWVTEELSLSFSHSLAKRLQEQYKTREGKGTLRLSRMGPQCPCALWHSVHHPEKAQPLRASTMNVFSFGHMIEAWLIALARAAGHTVEGEQDAVSVDGIVGHRDCIIDGCIVDVKSTTSLGFKEFKDGLSTKADDWGYLSQLDGYMLGSREDALVRVKDKAYLLIIDKQLGHMYLHEHKLREDHIRERIRNYREIVSRGSPPPCECKTAAIGSSGNVGLAYPSTYNSFKFCCKPHIRTFLYAGKAPVYLTKVVRRPDVPEVDKYGKAVYN